MAKPVIDEGTWAIDGLWLVLKEWPCTIKLEDIHLNLDKFWV